MRVSSGVSRVGTFSQLAKRVCFKNIIHVSVSRIKKSNFDEQNPVTAVKKTTENVCGFKAMVLEVKQRISMKTRHQKIQNIHSH